MTYIHVFCILRLRARIPNKKSVCKQDSLAGGLEMNAGVMSAVLQSESQEHKYHIEPTTSAHAGK